MEFKFIGIWAAFGSVIAGALSALGVACTERYIDKRLKGFTPATRIAYVVGVAMATEGAISGSAYTVVIGAGAILYTMLDITELENKDE